MNSTPREDRICVVCNKLEDEFHFLFECTLYTTIRARYMSRYFRVRPSMFKAVELLKSENIKTIRNLAVYVLKAFVIRRNYHNIQ